jgi:hypothetical protein
MNSNYEIQNALLTFEVQREIEKAYLIREREERESLTNKYVDNADNNDGWWTL